MPDRITLSRAKGWRMPPNTVKVDRSTKWGNPWVIVNEDDANLWVCRADRAGNPRDVDLEELVPDDVDAEEFLVAYFRARALDTLPNLAPLRGKNLACWCKPGAPCHADVLLELANG